MNILDDIELRNQQHRAQWALKWHQQGGSCSWSARPYPDLRNEDQLRRFRAIEVARRHVPRPRQVINLAAWRFEQKRRRRYRDMVAAS